jgi:hypothetical protein
MYLISARLRSPAGAPHSTGMRGALQRCTDIRDQVEHIYVEEDIDGARVVLFIRQTDLPRAESAARDLCLRTLGSRPELREWTLESCRASLVPPGEAMILGPLEGLDEGDSILPLQDPDPFDC